MPSAASACCSAVSFQGVEPAALPPRSSFGMPTGTTPSASATSALTQETVAIRVGAAATVVSPKAWVTVTG